MGGFNNSVVGGVGDLIRSWIQSVPFISGSTGWRISKNGSAEFNNVVIRNGTVVSGTQLEYSGVPGLGTLFVAIADSAGVDSYGNAYPAGITIFTGTESINFSASGGSVIATWKTGNVNEQVAPFIIADRVGAVPLAYERFRFVGPINSAQQDEVEIHIHGSTDNSALPAAGIMYYWTPPGQAGGTAFQMLGWDYTGGKLTGKTVATQPGTGTTVNNPAQDEIWHIPTLQAGWGAGSNSGGIQQLRYRLLPTNEVELQGVIHSTSATPASVMFILPAGYTPPSTVQRMGIIINKGGGVIADDIVDFHPGGNVQLGINATAIGNDVHFDHTFSLEP